MSALRHEVLAALGEPVRLELVERLAEGGPMTLTRLITGLPLTRQGVRRHVQVLEEAEVVFLSKQGREQIATLNLGALLESRAWMEGLARQWETRLERLRSIVEEG